MIFQNFNRAVLLLATFVSSYFFAQAQQNNDGFIIEYGKYNRSKSLRLNYIHYTENMTIVSITYTGILDMGQFKEIFLNNYRIRDKDSGDEFPLSDANVIPRKHPEFHTFLENSDAPINIEISFERLPSAVKNIDIIESDGDIYDPYNFTFLNLSINKNVSIYGNKAILDIVSKFPLPYVAVVYTQLETSISVSVNGYLLGILPVWEPYDFELDPDCNDLNVYRLIFPDSKERSLYAKERSGDYWSLRFVPQRYAAWGGCKKIKLGTGN